jgi:hypothetical protein
MGRFAVLLGNSHWRLLRRERGTAMCDKRVEIDGKIEHYQRMSSRITDQAMRDGIKGLIEQQIGPTWYLSRF